MAARERRHGDYAGVMQHKRRGEPLCEDCLQAQAVYARDWRARTGRTTGEFVSRATIRTYVTGGPA